MRHPTPLWLCQAICGGQLLRSQSVVLVGFSVSDVLNTDSPIHALKPLGFR